jgi:ribosomal protein S18 acetylase RimI-like enzyme
MPILELKSAQYVQKIIDFILSKRAFDFELAVGEREQLVINVNAALQGKAKYWYMVDSNDQVIAAIGVNENSVKTGGYAIGWLAVDVDYRKQGLASELFKVLENYLITVKARYLVIDTGDGKSTLPARKLYEKMGFVEVGHIPGYYSDKVGDGMILYYKRYH